MISEKLKIQLGSWKSLYPFFESDAWAKIKEQIKPDFSKTTPEIDVWFKAFKECNQDSLKVVWLGLSPYYTTDSYTKKNVADGLAFSTDTKHSVPPSLFQLYKGYESDEHGGMNLYLLRNNDLTFLANQGVLLLNSALTTTYGNPDSHLQIWQPFILNVIDVLNKQEGIIFCGFGKVANELLTRVDKTKHIVFEREHPAAAAYRGGSWKHDKLFTKVNEQLEKSGKEAIAWDKFYVDFEPAPF
jgi:uracil-DNA glycosylase